MRMSYYMNTYCGNKVNPLELKPEDIELIDIAHALSQQCRFNGHCNGFYSVASHSIALSMVVSAPARKYALMHDAPETYFGDTIRPLKNLIPDLEKYQLRAWEVIKERFNLDPIHEEEVMEADTRMLCTENLYFNHLGLFECCAGVEPYNLTPKLMLPEMGRAEFMSAYTIYDNIREDA